MKMDHKLFFLNYDNTVGGAVPYLYGRLSERFQGFFGIKTTGAAVIIDAVTPGSAPFAPIIVGDYIQFQVGEVWSTRRKVLTKPSQDQITISGANVNLGAGITSWYFHKAPVPGSTDADGGHSIEGYDRVWVEFEIPTLAATGGVDYRIEVRGRAPGALWAPSASAPPATIATAQNKAIEVLELIGSVRVGLKGNTDAAGTDDITVLLTGSPRW